MSSFHLPRAGYGIQAQLLGIDEPPPYWVMNPDGTSPYVLLCEHASPTIPRALDNLGLTDTERMRHIGWDIGASALAQRLSDSLDAALFGAGYSRLVIDCNRPLDNRSLIPEISEATPVPGNKSAGTSEKDLRIESLFRPFHRAVARRLDLRQATARRTMVVGVHSYTPVYHGKARPWHAGILYAGATEFAGVLMKELRSEPGLEIGDNEPYRIDGDDYTVPVHGDARGLPSVLIEIRHDLIDSHEGVNIWADRLTRCLILADALTR